MSMENVRVFEVSGNVLDDITVSRLRNNEDSYGLAVVQEKDSLSVCVENCSLDTFLMMPDALKESIARTIWARCSWLRLHNA